MSDSRNIRSKKSYSQKLKDPRWQKKRLEVFERDGWCCQICSDSSETLNVHHKVYRRPDPWDCPLVDLVTLCESCHESETYERPEAESELLRVLKKAGLFTSHLGYIIEYYEKQCEYYDLLEEDKWKAREQELLKQSKVCFICENVTNLVIHHKNPTAVIKKPWDLPDRDFDFICKQCKRNESGRHLLDEYLLLSVLRNGGFYSEDIGDLATDYSVSDLKKDVRRRRLKMVPSMFLVRYASKERNITYDQLMKLTIEAESFQDKVIPMEFKNGE